MTTGDGPSRNDDATAADDPVVVDLDAPEPDPGDAPEPTGRPPHFRTLASVAVLVGVLALGVFIGNLNAGNAAANNLRVFPGDLVVTGTPVSNSQTNASLTVINAGEQPVDVVGIDSPALGPDMTRESITVPPGERVAADMTLTPDCDALPAPGTAANTIGEQPLALDVTTADGEYTLNTPVAIVPDHAMDSFTSLCVRDRVDVGLMLEVTAADDSRPDGSLPSRASLTAHNEGVEGEVIEIRSHLPGFTLTTDSLPAPLGTQASSTFFDITWAVDDCALATSPDTARTGSHVGATVRAEIDGQTTERSVQRSLPGDFTLQLGLLAASSCPS